MLTLSHSVDEDQLAYALLGLDLVEMDRFARSLANAIGEENEELLKRMVTAMREVFDEIEAT